MNWQAWQPLHEYLNGLAEGLTKLQKQDLAGIVRDADSYFGIGSPSEFMGESWLALRAVLERREELPETLVAEIEVKVAEIKFAFENVGDQVQ